MTVTDFDVLFFGSIFYCLSMCFMFMIMRNVFIKYFRVVFEERCNFCGYKTNKEQVNKKG